MEFFIQQLVNGIALGSLYALTAIGYSLVYAVLELINFTHGTMYMVGAYLFYIFVSLVGMPFLPAFVLAIFLTGCLGYLIERYTLRFDGKYITVATANISYIQLFVIIMSVLMMVGLTLFINKSKTGMAMRATAQNAEATELMGIPVDRVVGLTFFFGAVLAAVSGIFACMIFRSVNLSIGVATGNKTFAATVLGGIGELRGAVLGGLLIGIVETFTAGYIGSSIRDIAAFVVLVIVLIFRPCGLLGKPVQKKV